MSVRSLLTPILDDDRLTRRLDDAEARMLIEWLVMQAERTHEEVPNAHHRVVVERLCRRARAIGRFVVLWCHECSPGAALQLAATERLGWPMPTGPMEPCELLGEILAWEES